MSLREEFESKKPESWKTFSNLVSEVLKKLDYEPGNRNYFQEALAYRGIGVINPSFERLEFLGDRVLKLIYGSELYTRFPTADPELLTGTVQQEESNENLAKLAHEIDIGEFRTVFSRGQLSPDVLADTFEALIGAIFLDTGKDLDKTTKIVRKILKLDAVELSENARMNLIDPKSYLISLLQKENEYEKDKNPKFEYDNIGMDHAPEIIATVSVVYKGKEYSTKGKSASKRKEAEKNACKELLQTLELKDQI